MLVVALFLTQVLLFALGILGPWRDAPELKNNGRLPRPIRMLLSFSLVVAAFVTWSSGAKYAVYTQWVAFGMLASFLGDLIMARLIPLPNRLIGGMIAFGIAHALYITAFASLIVGSFDSWFVGLFIYGSFTILGWQLLIRNPEKETAINLGALVYGVWVGTMASFALALAVAVGGGFWLTALGGLSFVASDFTIGVTDIRGIKIKNANDWIWLTYAMAQMGIVYAGWVVG